MRPVARSQFGQGGEPFSTGYHKIAAFSGQILYIWVRRIDFWRSKVMIMTRKTWTYHKSALG